MAVCNGTPITIERFTPPEGLKPGTSRLASYRVSIEFWRIECHRVKAIGYGFNGSNLFILSPFSQWGSTLKKEESTILLFCVGH